MLIIWHAASLADCNIVPALSYSLVSYIIATCITPELSKHNFWSNMLVMFKPIGGLTGHQGQHKHDTKYRRRYSAMGLLLQFISLVHLNALMNNGLWILRMMRVKAWKMHCQVVLCHHTREWKATLSKGNRQCALLWFASGCFWLTWLLLIWCTFIFEIIENSYSLNFPSNKQHHEHY